MTEGNGKPPVDEEALATTMLGRMPEETLRKMNHREWLGQCAFMLEGRWTSDGPQMSPIRAGMVNRLRLARDYIELLERDARKRRVDLKMLKEDLENALNALKTPSNLKGTGA